MADSPRNLALWTNSCSFSDKVVLLITLATPGIVTIATVATMNSTFGPKVEITKSAKRRLGNDINPSMIRMESSSIHPPKNALPIPNKDPRAMPITVPEPATKIREVDPDITRLSISRPN